MTKRRLRSQGQRLVVVVLVLLLAVVAGLALVQKWQGAAWWVVAGAAALAAFLGGAGPLWQRWREQRTAGAGVVRRSVRTTGKTVTDVSFADLRVHKAVVDVPYLPRAAKEHEVGEHLRARRPVLIVGPSMVGKTRLAAAVVRQILPDKPLLVPDAPYGLLDLDKADIVPRDQVIWLDDLDRFFSGGGLSAGLVRRLGESNWLVATLRAHEWDRLQPTDQLRSPEWDVLTMFELVILDRHRDRPAEDDLHRAIPDEELRARIARTGIGEYVGAAEHVRDQLVVGEHANPVGYALVVGAADWSRTGITRPVPAQLLRQLSAPHLTGRRRLDLDDDEQFGAALEWATREINPTVSLLAPGDGTYGVYDYALDQLATAGETIPTATWHLALDEADDVELLSVGNQAFNHHNLLDIAEQAWRKAVDAGVREAMVNLGVLMVKRGEVAEAERWYRRAADAGDVGAMTALGVVLAARGESAEAEHWLRKGADASDLDGIAGVAMLMVERDELAEAEHWLQKAADAGQAHAMWAEAATILGMALDERGEQAEAERWIRKAAETGNAFGMCNLGVLLEQQGEKAEAEHWYRKAAETGNTDAMYTLGLLLAERGEEAEAERWYRKAADAGNAGGMSNLGVLLAKRGEETEAERWIRKAADAGNANGMSNLGVLLAKRGEEAEAERWYRKAADAGDADAMSNLGWLLAQKGEKAEAERWYRKAADAGKPTG